MTRKHTCAPGFFRCTLALAHYVDRHCCSLPACHKNQVPRRTRSKSAYLYNFGSSWNGRPKLRVSGSSSAFVFWATTVLPLTLETTIAGESINGKRVLMKRVASHRIPSVAAS